MRLATTPAQCSIVLMTTALAACAGTWGGSSEAVAPPRIRSGTQVLRVTSSSPAVVYLDERHVGVTPVDVRLRYQHKKVVRTQDGMIALGITGLAVSPALGYFAYKLGELGADLSEVGILSATAWSFAVTCGIGAAMALVGGIAALANTRKRQELVVPGSFTIGVFALDGKRRYRAKIVGRAPFSGLRRLHFDTRTRQFTTNIKPTSWLLLQHAIDGPDEPGAHGAPR